MVNQQLPKILAISLSTWRKDSGIHTQTDLFKFWAPNKVAQIYLKADFPNTDVCSRFFQISEPEIIRSIFNRNSVGREVNNTSILNTSNIKDIQSESARYAKAHKKKNWFLTVVRELVWMAGRWKTKALKDFVDNVDADIYFVPIYPVAYTGWLQWYIIKSRPRPYVCYLADDNYSYASCGRNVWAWIHRWMLRRIVRKLATNCNQMFTITQIEAEETDRDFGTKSVVLTKGINYANLMFDDRPLHSPIRMVYTGNLMIGRATSLVEISKAMANINRDGLKVTLDIYTPTKLDNETTRILNSNGSKLHDPVAKQAVNAIQQDADIVIFVESLEKKHRYDARLSFSTKLTDYFASGKCIFAIGDKDIAPIQYLRQYECAVTCNSYNQIEEALNNLLSNPELIKEYGRRAFETGRINHEESKVKDTFISTIIKAAKQLPKV